MDKNTTECNLPLALEVIGGKWKTQILYYLSIHGTLRNSELRKLIKHITGAMLSKSLRDLEKYGLVIRNQYNEMPLRVEYSLGPNSKELLDIIFELNKWACHTKNDLEVHAQNATD